MAFYPVFLTLVVVVRNQSEELAQMLKDVAAGLTSLVSDYELVVVDNASSDNSVAVLKSFVSEQGEPNLQVYALTKEVDADTATWVGLENALGDYVVVIDPMADDVKFLPQLLESAVSGAEVVFAYNTQKSYQSLMFRCAFAVFNALYKQINGLDLAREAPHYRVLSKRIVNFILQHPQPALYYRQLPASGGFTRVNLNYSAQPKHKTTGKLFESIDRGMRMLVSNTRAPMRLVTTLSMFGAFANLAYSVYVVAVGLFKTDVAPGWVSLSLQQSGMFFLISLVLMVLGEYIVNMARLTNEGPLYHVGQEFTSSRMTRREKLNIEESIGTSTTVPASHQKLPA
ncbi:MAG: glycosyl transferase [Comamonadaceae bacterium CG2_30_59_20]|nr:MAG: glycosyl transferase [Comamonadaceae bacterium CG2_30_59_20]